MVQGVRKWRPVVLVCSIPWEEEEEALHLDSSLPF